MVMNMKPHDSLTCSPNVPMDEKGIFDFISLHVNCQISKATNFKSGHPRGEHQHTSKGRHWKVFWSAEHFEMSVTMGALIDCVW